MRSWIRSLPLGKLLVVGVVVAVLGIGITTDPSPATAATGSMAVDCDAPGPGGLPATPAIQLDCAYPVGTTFGVEILVGSPPTLPDSDGYFAFQTKLRWTDFALQYNPTGFSTADEKAGGWPNCDIAGRDTTNPSPVPNTETVLFFCQPNPTLTVGSTHTGKVLQHEFRCETDSQTTLTLVPRPGDINQGTHFNDPLFQALEPSLLSATITCGTPDLDPPETTIDSGPTDPTNDSTPTFTFSSDEAGSTFECRVDADPFAACTTPHTVSPALSDGAHTFEVRAIDPSLNVDPTPASDTFTVDATPPETTIDSGPSGLTNDATPTFTFSADEGGSTFECRVDTDPFAVCTSPETISPALSDGAHTFEVRASDALGNTDPTPASRSFTVDTAAPETTIDSGPSGPTADTTPTFTFSADEGGSTFECRVDSDPFAPCTSPETTAPLSDGPHTFEVRATDPAGNTDPTPASQSFSVDTTPPDTTIDSGPSGPTNDTTPTFTFSADEAGSTFECRVDAAAFGPCSGPGDAHTTAALAEGPHTFEVRATDSLGNTDTTPASRSFTVDTTAPDTTIDSGPSGLTNDATPTFTFSSSEAGSSFECRVDADPFASCSSPETVSSLSDGAHTFEVRAIDPAGNTDSTPASRSFTVDATPPQTTIDSGPTGPTTDTTPTFTFSADEGGSTFECRVDSDPFAACTSPETVSALSDGPHTFEVRATDPAGNTDPTPASQSFSVDTTPPDTTIDSGPSGPTNDTTPTFTFSADEGGSTFECRVDGAAFGPCSGPGDTHTTGVLAEGPHTFEVRATDALGNTDTTPASRSFTVDTTAPDTTIDSGPSGLTNDTTPTFTFSSTEGGSTFECRVDADSFASCSSPETLAPALSDGPHTFEVRATDPAGNTDPTPASQAFTVDSTPPQTTIDSGPSGPTSDTTPTFTFSADEGGSTFECRVDADAFAACTSPHTVSPALFDGPHTFEVRATDPAGNTDPTPAGQSFTVDTTPPDTTIDSGPSGPTNDTTPTFTFSSNDAGATFECRVDGAAFGACSGPGDSHTTGALSAGPHTFEVRATDLVGLTDPTPASRSFTVDTTPPDTTIDSGPSGLTNDSTPTFTFSSTEGGSSFECRIDADPFESCSSPETVSPPLADGPHTFEVRATDPAGNTDPTPASQSFTVDATAPQTTIDSGPSGPTSDTTPTFTFSADEGGATFECRVDGGPFGPCSGPGDAHTTAPLADGPHTFEVRASDALGNTDPTPASRSFSVDTTPPDTSIDSGPSGLTNDATPTFTFSSEPGSTFECRVDADAFAPCSSPHTVSPALSEGAHTFEVRATDAVSLTDPTPASRSFTVDSTAPDTTIDSGPSGPTNDPTPTFTFSSSEGGSTFECRVDADAFAPCSSPHTVSPALSDGAHTFEVRAIDTAGNADASPASRSFTVDSTPPQTTIDSGPSDPTNDSTPTFTFSSNEAGSTFECRVDAGPFAPCTSPHTVSPALLDGVHTFEVRAIDPAGNTDPTPASQTFTVDTAVIQTTIDSGPSGPTNDSTPTFTFSSDDPNATFECRVDADAFAPCTTPHTVSPALSDGPHTFEVRATDLAGNTDATPALAAFTVDTTPPETTIDSGPTGSPTTPEFTFSSNEPGSTFECSIDGGPFTPCSSPHTVSPPVSEGPHTFEVRATDPAGNTDPTPAIEPFAVPCGGVDSDCDGFADTDEVHIGTDVFDACPEPDVDPDPLDEWHQPGHPYIAGDNAWAPDGNNDGVVVIGDIGLVVLAFGQPGEDHPRRDLVPDGSVVIGDIGVAVAHFGQSCRPRPPGPVATGFHSPGAEEADTGGDGDGFELNAVAAFGDGAGFASNIKGSNDRHQYYNYGFVGIPGGASILGIEVRLDWWLDSTGGNNRMEVELSWDGGASWTAAKTDSQETTSEHTAIVGGADDTWGRTWTAGELSISNFRVRLTSKGAGQRDFFLDWVPVQVTYE